MDTSRPSQHPSPFSYSTRSPAIAICLTFRPPTLLLPPPIPPTTWTQLLVMVGRMILMGHQALVTMGPLTMPTLMKWSTVQLPLEAMARLSVPALLLTIPGQLPSAKPAAASRKTT